MIAGPAAGAVDLLIRTGGEKRLSDFLLWESAYAELWFYRPHVARSSTASDLADAVWGTSGGASRRFGAA